MPIEDILRYGNWSGPGWTAGVKIDEFRDNGWERVITDDDREMLGIDRYDNFVAKAHDLNEYAALDKLRPILASLGLANNATLQTPSGLLQLPTPQVQVTPLRPGRTCWHCRRSETPRATRSATDRA